MHLRHKAWSHQPIHKYPVSQNDEHSKAPCIQSQQHARDSSVFTGSSVYCDSECWLLCYLVLLRALTEMYESNTSACHTNEDSSTLACLSPAGYADSSMTAGIKVIVPMHVVMHISETLRATHPFIRSQSHAARCTGQELKTQLKSADNLVPNKTIHTLPWSYWWC